MSTQETQGAVAVPALGKPGLAAGEPSLGRLAGYFLRLRPVGFGGPVVLVSNTQRDLVERRGQVDDREYKLGLALAQIMPGPLAAQLAIAPGYFLHGVLGVTLVGLTFVLPSFLMVLALSAAHVAFGGLWWIQALLSRASAAVVAIAAWKLARKINGRDPLLWGIAAVLFAVTAITEAELAEFFVLAGLLVLLVKAPPRRLKAWMPFLALTPAALALPLLVAAQAGSGVLWEILLFFTRAGACVFGSGLAVVPFLQQEVVERYGWLTAQQVLDAVAVAMITPGPAVIMVAFIGLHDAGLPGATLVAVSTFLPVRVLTVVPAPWFVRRRDNAQPRAFSDGAHEWGHCFVGSQAANSSGAPAASARGTASISHTAASWTTAMPVRNAADSPIP